MRGLRFILILVCSLFVFQTVVASTVHACDLEDFVSSSISSAETKDHSGNKKDQTGGHNCLCSCAHQPACQVEVLSLNSIFPSLKEVNIYKSIANLSSSIKGLFKPPRA